MTESVSKLSGGTELLRRLERQEELTTELLRRLERVETRVENLASSYKDSLVYVGKRLDKADLAEEQRHKIIADDLQALRDADNRSAPLLSWLQMGIGALVGGTLVFLAKLILEPLMK